MSGRPTDGTGGKRVLEGPIEGSQEVGVFRFRGFPGPGGSQVPGGGPRGSQKVQKKGTQKQQIFLEHPLSTAPPSDVLQGGGGGGGASQNLARGEGRRPDPMSACSKRFSAGSRGELQSLVLITKRCFDAL